MSGNRENLRDCFIRRKKSKEHKAKDVNNVVIDILNALRKYYQNIEKFDISEIEDSIKRRFSEEVSRHIIEGTEIRRLDNRPNAIVDDAHITRFSDGGSIGTGLRSDFLHIYCGFAGDLSFEESKQSLFDFFKIGKYENYFKDKHLLPFLETDINKGLKPVETQNPTQKGISLIKTLTSKISSTLIIIISVISLLGVISFYLLNPNTENNFKEIEQGKVKINPPIEVKTTFPLKENKEKKLRILVTRFLPFEDGKESFNCPGARITEEINDVALKKKLPVIAIYREDVSSPTDTISSKIIISKHNADLLLWGRLGKSMTCGTGELCFRSTPSDSLLNFINPIKKRFAEMNPLKSSYIPNNLRIDHNDEIRIKGKKLDVWLRLLVAERFGKEKPDLLFVDSSLSREEQAEEWFEISNLSLSSRYRIDALNKALYLNPNHLDVLKRLCNITNQIKYCDQLLKKEYNSDNLLLRSRAKLNQFVYSGFGVTGLRKINYKSALDDFYEAVKLDSTKIKSLSFLIPIKTLLGSSLGGEMSSFIPENELKKHLDKLLSLALKNFTDNKITKKEYAKILYGVSIKCLLQKTLAQRKSFDVELSSV
ncbi:MAG: hypothetical protein GKR88_02140 [Flavobacteriaceae bacterium]|nr:MAG: hypothetical protein GKR88_02140 [Flavobacteriaceae bacterium]